MKLAERSLAASNEALGETRKQLAREQVATGYSLSLLVVSDVLLSLVGGLEEQGGEDTATGTKTAVCNQGNLTSLVPWSLLHFKVAIITNGVLLTAALSLIHVYTLSNTRGSKWLQVL